LISRCVKEKKTLIATYTYDALKLADILQYAEQDIKDRWQWYKERHIRGLKK
jgi:hypothetical protein